MSKPTPPGEMTPSISSEANTSPGTRMPGLYVLGKSHRRSSIFSRMFFQLETMAYHLIFRRVWLAVALRPCTLDIEKHLRPVSVVLGGHLQHVPGYRLHPEVQSVARWVYPLAQGPHPHALIAYLFHDEPREQHLLRVPVVQQLRQPAHEQSLTVARLDVHLP